MEEKNQDQDLDALLAENRRLKQELSRFARPQPEALYRPPWQPQPAQPRRRRVSSDVNEATQLPALAPGYPSLRKSVAQSLPALRRSTSPIADLRRCFLSAGASRAFEQLDVNRTGFLNFHDFQRAVEAFDAGFEPSLIVEVFGALAVDGQLSIAKLLDLHPLERSSHMDKMDTQSLFKAYKHKSFGHRNLNRQPRWHEAERRCEFHGYQETLRRRRDLRKQFREDRQGIKMEQKRELVQGIQPLESFSGFREQEQRNMEVHRQRIQDAIRGCSRARYNLVEIQKQMADLVADHDEEREVTFAFKDLFRNNVARTEAELASDRMRFTLTPKDRKQKSVIFGSAGCGMAGHQGYDPKRSQTFAKGRLVQELSYGSGDALCSNAFDRLDIGPEENGLHVERQPIWLVEKAQMEILENSRFQAILGIGPPTAVKQQAKNDLEYLQSLDNKLKDWNVTVPASIKSHMKSRKTADFLLGNLDDNVPENLQLQFLSICLRAASGSKGVAVWHDADPRHRSPFKRLAVIGKITWGLSLKNVHLVSKGQRIPIACADGCGAVLDTGTSLITAPSDAVKKMGQVLQALGANCLQEHSLPHLEFQLGGETLSLPPAAFIGFVKGIMPAPWRLRFHQEPFIQVEDCELLMMDTGKMTSTEHGPLWIIGMPFFRHFYTTFDYGSSDHETSIWVAEASPDCQPQETTTNLLQVAGTSLLRVNQSKLRLPGWLVNGKTMPF